MVVDPQAWPNFSTKLHYKKSSSKPTTFTDYYSPRSENMLPVFSQDIQKPDNQFAYRYGITKSSSEFYRGLDVSLQKRKGLDVSLQKRKGLSCPHISIFLSTPLSTSLSKRRSSLAQWRKATCNWLVRFVSPVGLLAITLPTDFCRYVILLRSITSVISGAVATDSSSLVSKTT
ncbi:uncharacterized protein LOC106397911 isoform X2 [Brassica napus]|uniref:uncharacterized protein LOC106397911 isoform X2 n=1 Tax=Brassica napus TaxID=3708 RepID=UPI0006AA8541|nr:uncharacterized protein LOC106397911 isoform X2 [Brassica napus]